ncbi:MAG: glycosyltransferase N-terminal domain-containing protein [Chitinophagaceae bacterium]
MGVLVYNISIAIFIFLIKGIALFNPKVKKWLKQRAETKDDYKKWNLAHKKTILFHCSSVGELEQCIPLIEKYEADSYSPIISFFSISGYQYALKKYPHYIICYLPFDQKKNIQEFIKCIHPTFCVIVKYELWHHLIQELKRSNIPVFLVCARFDKNHVYFKWYASFLKKILHRITFILVQDQTSFELLKKQGITHTDITGDMRFDRNLTLSQQPFHDAIIEDFIAGHPVFIAGSIWAKDLEWLQAIMSEIPKNYKIILAPHEVNHFNTDWIQEPFTTYTHYKKDTATILILNTVGLLAKTYRFASLTYIGGGFRDKGLHNTLEAAIYGNPILIGNKYDTFNEVVEMVDQGIIISIHDAEEGRKKTRELVQNPQKIEEIKAKMSAFMHSKTNSTSKNYVYINKLLSSI